MVYPGKHEEAFGETVGETRVNPVAVLPLPWLEPSNRDLKSNSNLDTNCVQVLVIHMPNSVQYLPQKIRELWGKKETAKNTHCVCP